MEGNNSRLVTNVVKDCGLLSHSISGMSDMFGREDLAGCGMLNAEESSEGAIVHD